MRSGDFDAVKCFRAVESRIDPLARAGRRCDECDSDELTLRARWDEASRFLNEMLDARLGVPVEADLFSDQALREMNRGKWIARIGTEA